jgi:mRNA interferase MazF
MQRGQVWLHESPTRKPRPVLILSRDSVIGLLRTVVAVPATRSIRNIPTEVPLDESDGIRTPCVLSTDNVGLYNKAYLTRHLTTLSPQRLAQVCHALSVAIDC